MPGRGLRVTSLGYISLLHEKILIPGQSACTRRQNQPCFRTKIYTQFQQNSLRAVYVVELHIYAYLKKPYLGK